MTEKASADDFQVQDFLKKKKKKKKYKEHKEHENDERESIQDAELCSASPPLLEDQAAQSGEGFKKEKRKKKQEKQQSLLSNSCVELESDINNETGVDASQKKKKKKKWKHNDDTDEESNAVCCIAVNQSSSDISQEIDADYVYLKLPVKKKRKEKLPEEDEVGELPECIYLEPHVKKKKKRKEKLPKEDEVGELPECIYLEPHVKKKKRKEKLPEEDEVCELPESTYLEAPVKKKKRKEKLPKEDEVCELPESTYLEAPVKKKKRKEKLPEEDGVGDLPESTYLEPPVKKKKRKEKLPEEDEVCELPESTYLEPPVKMKKRKEKLPKEDEVYELPEPTYLEAPVKKKKGKEKLPEEDAVGELPESTYLEPPVKKKGKEKLPKEDGVGELPESTYLEPPVKKKEGKEKLPEEDEVCELPESTYLELPVKKKKRKEKLPKEDEVCELPECTYLEPPVKKKKRKEKLPEEDALGELPECIYLEPSLEKNNDKLPEEDKVGGLPESIYLEPPLEKKKRKEKLPKEDAVGELPECIYLEPSVMNEIKENFSEEDEVHELPISETHDKNGSKRSKSKKKTCSSTLDIQEADVTVDQSLLSPAEQNGQGKGTELPLVTEADGVASSQQWHEDGDCDASPAGREDSMVVPANLSKPTKAANQPCKNRPVRSTKIKSRAYITEESSSDSDVMTPVPFVWEPGRRENQNSSFTKTVTTGDGSLDDGDDDDDEEYLNSTMCVMDLDTAKKELEEFIPHVRNISDSSIMKIVGRDLARFKEFKKQGIAIRFGRFSEKENNQIRKNIGEFLEITGIDSAEKVLFTSRYPEEKKTINRLKVKHLFCEKISQGIPRLWTLIYYRARKIFDPHNYKGRYTNEEKEKLKQYYALHGNDWKKISEMMSRSNLSVAMKYSEIKSGANYGPWSKEEVRKLMRAVEEVIKKRLGVQDGNSNREILIDRDKLFQKFPWTEIETKVGTRFWRQCKQKWVTILTNKLKKGQQLCSGIKGLQVKIHLIKRLRELNVEDPSEVKWEELSDVMGGVPRDYVQGTFYKLKVAYVPLWRRKTFPEIIEYLYEKKLPELEEKLEKEKARNPSSDNSEPGQRKVFLLSDIFDTSEEDSD